MRSSRAVGVIRAGGKNIYAVMSGNAMRQPDMRLATAGRICPGVHEKVRRLHALVKAGHDVTYDKYMALDAGCFVWSGC